MNKTGAAIQAAAKAEAEAKTETEAKEALKKTAGCETPQSDTERVVEEVKDSILDENGKLKESILNAWREEECPEWGKSKTKPDALSQPIDISFAKIATYLIDKNPFYLLSALLAIYAQSVLFTANPLRSDTELPAFILASYTALLAVAGTLIVRWGKVWSDARSVLLIVIMLLQIIPAGLDGILLNNSTPSAWLWMGGMLAISVFASETLRRGLGIKLPKDILATFYAFMLLNCGWPLLLAHLVKGGDSATPTAQAILLFPVIGGALLLCLIPAVRRGPDAAKDSGTPWLWPYFPWSAFAVIAAGIAFRTYLMAISFIGGKGAGPYANLESGFLPWMIAVPLLAVGVLLIEEAAMRGKSATAFLANAIPVAAFILCCIVPNGEELRHSSSRVFVTAIPNELHPLLFLLPVALAYFAWGFYRGVKGMDAMFHILLGIIGVAGMAYPHDRNIAPFISIWGWLASAAFIVDMAVMSFLKRKSQYFFFGVLQALIFSAICFDNSVRLEDYAPVILIYGVFTALFLCEALFKDNFAKIAGMLAAGVMPFIFFGTMAWLDNKWGVQPDFGLSLSMAALLIAMQVAGAVFVNRKHYKIISSLCALILCGFLAHWNWNSIGAAFASIKKALPLLLSLGVLLIAFLTSLWKGGVFSLRKKEKACER